MSLATELPLTIKSELAACEAELKDSCDYDSNLFMAPVASIWPTCFDGLTVRWMARIA